MRWCEEEKKRRGIRADGVVLVGVEKEVKKLVGLDLPRRQT